MKISKIVAGVLLALSVIATGCGNAKEEENKVEEKTEVSEVSSAENETEEKVIIGWINADTTTPSQICLLYTSRFYRINTWRKQQECFPFTLGLFFTG